MKRLYRLYGIEDDSNPSAVITVLFIAPVVFSLAWAYMAGWLA